MGSIITALIKSEVLEPDSGWHSLRGPKAKVLYDLCSWPGLLGCRLPPRGQPLRQPPTWGERHHVAEAVYR